MKRPLLAAGLAALTVLAATAPSVAQYYDPDDRPRRFDRYDRGDRFDRGDRYDPYDRPRRRFDYEPRPRPMMMGNLCVTSRGNCYTRPSPNQSPCACNIPGFGVKRGAILAQPRY